MTGTENALELGALARVSSAAAAEILEVTPPRVSQLSAVLDGRFESDGSKTYSLACVRAYAAARRARKAVR